MRLLIGTSFKMYFTHAQTMQWLDSAVRYLSEEERQRPDLCTKVETFAIPQFPSLVSAIARTEGSQLTIGAQDVSRYRDGAYTGEVNAATLAEVGCSLVEIGHAERRRLFAETDEIIAAKTSNTLAAGLTPLLCLGEERRRNPIDAARVCSAQVHAALEQSEGAAPIVLAYEPVWAIGATQPADPEYIREVGLALKEAVAELDRPVRLLYGGSAGPGLLTEIYPAVDGVFLGRFAHDPRAFATVVNEAYLATS